MAASNRKKAEMYILFSCNAWHEYSSFEPKAVFSSIEKAADFLQKNSKHSINSPFHSKNVILLL